MTNTENNSSLFQTVAAGTYDAETDTLDLSSTTTGHDGPAEAIANVLLLCTNNDANGNTRRIYVGLDERGHIARGEVENYNPPEWVREHLQGCSGYEVRIIVSPSEWRQWRKRVEALA